MHDPLVVRGADRRQQRQRDVGDLFDRQRTAAPDVLPQVDALQVFHHQERVVVVVGPDVGHVDDVRMADAGGEPGLAHEASARLRHGGQGGAHRLDGDALADLQVERLVDGPHAALAHQPHDLVLPQHRAGGERPPRPAFPLSPHDDGVKNKAEPYVSKAGLPEEARRGTHG